MFDEESNSSIVSDYLEDISGVYTGSGESYERMENVVNHLNELNILESSRGNNPSQNNTESNPASIRSLNIQGIDYRVVYMNSKRNEYGTSIFLIKDELLSGVETNDEVSNLIDTELGNNVYKLSGDEW